MPARRLVVALVALSACGGELDSTGEGDAPATVELHWKV